MNVRRQGCAPRQGDVDVCSIRELPCVEVALLLQLVARVVVVERAVKLHLQPVVAVASRQSLDDTESLGDVLLRVRLSV